MKQSSNVVSENKPLLVFKHNPKAAGGTLLDIFKELKPKVARSENFYGKHPKDLTQIDHDEWLVHVRELTWTDPIFQRDGFVISSIREPCSHLISLWGFASVGRGGIIHTVLKYGGEEWTEQALGKDAPLFSSPSDIERFQNKFVPHEKMTNITTARFRQIYAPRSEETKLNGPPVDCWVYVENFVEDTISCLKQYERQGGYVDWTVPKVKELLAVAAEKKHQRRLIHGVESKNGIESPQLAHHASCSTYFSKKGSAALMEEKNSFVYRLFGYGKCCEKSHSIQTNITASYINLVREQDLAKLDSSASMTSEPPHDGRDLLIFKSNRGVETEILDVLREIKPVEMSRDEFTQVVYHGSNYPQSVRNHFVNINDNENIIPSDQKYGFVISVIREPCSHFVAEFRSGSEGKGDLRAYWDRYSPEWTKDAYGKDSPGFDSDADVDRFRNIWYPKNEGLIGNYFKQNYLQGRDDGKPPVDCWVVVEDFETSMLSCLQQYEAQGGEVDWNKPSLLKMMDTVKKTQQNVAKQQDNDSLLCSKYFNDDMSASVVKGRESFLYNTFLGYDQCCEGELSLNYPLKLDDIIDKQQSKSKEDDVQIVVPNDGVNDVKVDESNDVEVSENLSMPSIPNSQNSGNGPHLALSLFLIFNLLLVVVYLKRSRTRKIEQGCKYDSLPADPSSEEIVE